MLRISLIELLSKGIPEGLISVFGIFVLTKTKIDVKKYFISSISLIFLTYLIRFLPLGYGVNIMISSLVIMILSVTVINIDLSKVIKSSLIILLIIIISETITIGIMNSYFGKEKLTQIMSEPVSKSIASIPSTLLFGIIIVIIFLFFRYKTKVKKDKNGEDISNDSK